MCLLQDWCIRYVCYMAIKLFYCLLFYLLSNWCNSRPFISKDPWRPHTGNTQWSMWVLCSAIDVIVDPPYPKTPEDPILGTHNGACGYSALPNKHTPPPPSIIAMRYQIYDFDKHTPSNKSNHLPLSVEVWILHDIMHHHNASHCHDLCGWYKFDRQQKRILS